MKKNSKGFTLPELMIVVLIMAVLMAIATPMWLNSRARANARACKSNLEIIRASQKEWALDNPDAADAGYTITSADIDEYIDGGWAGLKCPSTDTDPQVNDYVMPAIDVNGNIPNPTCPYEAKDPDHSL